MSAHYLVDVFGNPLFPLSVPILDSREPTAGQSLTNGAMVVRVPDYVQVIRPADLNDLLTQKYGGLLAFYAGFGNIAYDDLIDPTHIDLTTSTRVRAGKRNTVCVAYDGYLQSMPYALPWAGPGVGPTVAIITWELFDQPSTDPATGLYQRSYQEQTASRFLAEVSFDNGAHWNAVSDQGVFNIPVGHQGTDFIIRFHNWSPTGGSEHWLGSWAVIY